MKVSMGGSPFFFSPFLDSLGLLFLIRNYLGRFQNWNCLFNRRRWLLIAHLHAWVPKYNAGALPAPNADCSPLLNRAALVFEMCQTAWQALFPVSLKSSCAEHPASSVLSPGSGFPGSWVLFPFCLPRFLPGRWSPQRGKQIFRSCKLCHYQCSVKTKEKENVLLSFIII